MHAAGIRVILAVFIRSLFIGYCEIVLGKLGGLVENA